MNFTKEIKTIGKYLQKLAVAVRASNSNIEVVLIGKYIKTLSKAKDLFENMVFKEQNREQLSEGLLLVLEEIDTNILKNTKGKLCK